MPGPQSNWKAGSRKPFWLVPNEKTSKHMKRVEKMLARRKQGYSEVVAKDKSGFKEPGSQNLRKG